MTPLPAPAGEQVMALEASGFSLLNWNIMKGKRANWENDFRRLSSTQDLLIIQEAYLTDDMRAVLQSRHYNWDLSVAFEYRHINAGVLTASKIEPAFLCTFRSKEPLIRIPKTILITGYPLSGTDQLLMVANVHLINYTLTTSHFEVQFQRLEKIFSNHKGPLIVSGDFNTWSDERMDVVDATAGRLNLKAVIFNENKRTIVFGHHVDHIYYRGLELVEAVSPEVTTSDHNPFNP
jgi:endonuclease/exonuclease/phosphatase (EEP) superfamily protein YafD